MDMLLLAIFGGLLTGVTYAILALGLVLLFRATKVFNFAHGQFALAGAYLAAWMQEFPVLKSSGVGMWSAVVASILVVALAAALLYRFVLHRLTGLDHWLAVFATFGVAAMAESAMTLAFSGRDLILELPGMPTGVAAILDVRLSMTSIALAAASLVVFAITAQFIYRTSFGRRMTAAGHNPLLASLSGIPIDRCNTSAWALGGGLAALAGIAFGASNVVSPAMVHLGLLAFPALLLGGMDSIVGALIGGLIVGMIQGLIATYLDGGAVSMVVYAMLLAILLLKPEGLLGTREAARL